MDISKTIVIGVISGVFTSAFIFLCVQIFNKIITPWYRSIIYSGIDLTGTWKETVEHSGATDISEYELKQNERTIVGTKTIVKTYKATGRNETKTLILTGHFTDGHLLLTARSSNRKIQSLSTYLLKIGRGGAALMGQASWVDANNGIIHSRNIHLEREIA